MRDLVGVSLSSPTGAQNIYIDDSFTMTCSPTYSGNGGLPAIIYTAQWCDNSGCSANVYTIQVGTPTSDPISLVTGAVNPKQILDSTPWSYSVYGRNSGTAYIRCKAQGGSTCSGGCYSTIRQVTVQEAGDLPPTTTLTSPADQSRVLNSSVTFQCGASDDNGLQSMSLYGGWGSGWHLEETKALSGSSDSAQFTVSGLADGTYTWNCEAKDTANQTDFANSNWTVNIGMLNKDDIMISSDFEMGNLINVQHVEDQQVPYRYYTAQINYSTQWFSDKHWWFSFSLDNATQKRVHLEITNCNNADDTRFAHLIPVISYTGLPGDWVRLQGSEYSYDSDNNKYTIDFTPTASPVYVAPIPHYTNAMLASYLSSKASSPYMETSTISVTPEGRNVTLVTITDSSVSDEGKFKVFLLGGDLNSGEQQSSFYARGSIEFLLDESDETAAVIRKNYIFRVVPVQNPDSTYHGISRYTPVRDGMQHDLNRNWESAEPYKQPEVWGGIRSAIADWPADVFISYHGAVLADTQYFLYPGELSSQETALMDSIAQYWNETSARLSGSTVGLNYVEMANAGILSLLIEVSPNRIVPGGNIIDELYWMDSGKDFVLGIYNYLGVNDSDPPLVDVVEPLNGSIVNMTVAIKADASDGGSGIQGVEYRIDSDSYVPVAYVDPYYEAAWDTTAESNGLHTITVRATDNENNINTDSVQVNVQNSVPDLNVTVVTDKSQYTSGEWVSSITTVRDGQGNPVFGADLTVVIYRSDLTQAKACIGTTLGDGTYECRYRIGRSDPLGTWTVESDATETGYGPGHGETTFQVV
ncbi:MAG: Ig-like domain-containing protein [Nanoarchaeota archaeon]